eukprot:m.134743 g.134743  ORF g.134743 m.134743 type:complete len:77 (-) comp13964_c0_seq1:1587-1817(-)
MESQMPHNRFTNIHADTYVQILCGSKQLYMCAHGCDPDCCSTTLGAGKGIMSQYTPHPDLSRFETMHHFRVLADIL